MDIQFAGNGREVPFRPWRVADGKVLNRRFAFDTETTSIDQQRPWLTPTYVLGAASDGQHGFFILPQHVAAFLRFHGDSGLIFHNAAFDLAVIQQAAPELDVYQYVDRKLVLDTQLLHRLWRLATAGEVAGGKGQSTLDACVREHLGFRLEKSGLDADGDQVRTNFTKFLRRPPNEIPEEYLSYLATDVLATLAVFDQLNSKIDDLLRDSTGEWGYVSDEWQDECVARYGMLTHHLQLKAAIVLREVTANGLNVDPGRREKLKTHLQRRSDERREELRTFGYLPGEPSATKALQSILREISRRHPDVDLPLTPKRGELQTSEEALTPLKGDEPFITALLGFRGLEKLLKTFLNKLDRNVVHPQFQPLVRSGRTSSFGELNAQNLPRDDQIRSCFIPSPGNVFLVADYMTLELATLAGAVERQFKLPSEMRAAINGGHDLHRLVAAEVFGRAPESITKEERQKAKAINFGKPGGMGTSALRRYAKTSFNADLTELEAQEIANAWMRRFPEMEEFLRDGDDPMMPIAVRLNLTGATYCEATNSERFFRHNVNPDAPLAFLAGMLLKTIGNERPETGNGRPYSDDQQAYFWERLRQCADEFIPKMRSAIMTRQPSRELQREVIKTMGRGGVYTLTGRLRAKASYTERHNTVFQGLAADGAKEALWRIWRAGFRIVNFVHDEVVVEVPESSKLALQEAILRWLMIMSMESVVPGVRIDVDVTAASCWSKSAVRQLDETGKLIAWRAPDQPEADFDKVATLTSDPSAA